MKKRIKPHKKYDKFSKFETKKKIKTKEKKINPVTSFFFRKVADINLFYSVLLNLLLRFNLMFKKIH